MSSRWRDQDGDWKPPRGVRQTRQPHFDLGTLEEPHQQHQHALTATPQPEIPRTMYAFHANKANRWWSRMLIRGGKKKKKVVQSFEIQDSDDFADESGEPCADNDYNYDAFEVDYKPDLSLSFKADAATQTDDAKVRTNKSSAKFNWSFEIPCFFVACTYAILFNWLFVRPWLQSG